MTDRILQPIAEAWRWAMECAGDGALAAADWLARDIDPGCTGVFDLLADHRASLDTLRQAKSAFKTMRVAGETPADRQLAARLYAVTIAAALLRHGELITTQSRPAIIRALHGVEADDRLPPSLRDIASAARHVLELQSAPAAEG